MLRNYLVTALRNLGRNRLYAAITILGLAVAFTVAILVGQFVRNEFTYDRWIPGHERIYGVDSLSELAGHKRFSSDATTAGLAGRLRLGLPKNVFVARLLETSLTVRHRPSDTGVTDLSFAWADPEIFKVLPLPVLAGDLSTALQQPDTVVITRAVGRKYFGRDLPIGDTFEVQLDDNSWHALRVTAVLKDLPSNTSLGTEIFASGRSAYSRLRDLDAHPMPAVFFGGLETFVRLPPGGSTATLQNALDFAGRPDAEAVARLGGTKLTFHPTPLDDAHWTPQGQALPGTKMAGSKGIAYATLAIGALIVLVAGINFVTLMTARAARRGVEVGVRKAAGARRRDLVLQFMGEALIQVGLSALIAAALAEILVKPFDALVQRNLAIHFVHDPLLLAGLVGFALLVGVLSSIYPALVLSSFRPAAVLKGGIVQSAGSPFARATLVTIQFAVLVGLILTTTTIYHQIQFALSRGLGASDSGLIAAVFAPCGGAYSEEVRKLPGVSAAACSTGYALNLSKLMTQVEVGGGQRTTFDVEPVDVGFFELYGERPVAGRLFSRDHGEDQVLSDPNTRIQPTIVINETAARTLGYADPRAAIGQSMTWDRHLARDTPTITGRSQIIGVVRDEPATVRTKVEPTFYFLAPTYFDLLSIRLNGRDVPGTARAIEAVWKRTGNVGSSNPFFLSQKRRSLYLDLVIQGTATAICAGLSILLACLGLFALSAFMTERRIKEIGIRKAMGAGTRQVVFLLLWQFTIPVLVATAIAMPISFLAMDWWLHGFAYHVGLPAWTFVLAAVGAMGIAWLSVSYQSFMVARAKPVSALRYE